MAKIPAEVLSDDVIVERLRKADIVVARRTVAKYRDSLRIPSSVERRKMKMAPVRARPRARQFPDGRSLNLFFCANLTALSRRLTSAAAGS